MAITAPTWPAWGANLLESDTDYDINDVIKDEAGFDLHANWQKDGPAARNEARLKLNAGLFNRLFDKFKAAGRHYKRYGGSYHLVILTALAMRCGADISKEQLAYAKSVYRSAGLFKKGIDSFAMALKKYKNGKPYDFGSVGMYETMQENMLWGMGLMLPGDPEPVRIWGSQNGHTFGGRYFESGVPTSEANLKVIDEAAPAACDNCGKASTDLPADAKMKRCAKCRKACYCCRDCQAANWSVHKKSCKTPEQQAKLNAEGKGEGMYPTSPLDLFGLGDFETVVHPPRECDCEDENCVHADVRKHFRSKAEGDA